MVDASSAAHSVPLIQETAAKNGRCSVKLFMGLFLIGIGCVGIWHQANTSTTAIDMAALPMQGSKVGSMQPMRFPRVACGGLRGVACASQVSGNAVKEAQLEKMTKDAGFITALDESGGTSPKTLAAFGVPIEEQGTQDEMMAKVHGLRAKIMMDPTYKEGSVIGAILFEDTINRDVEGMPTTQYLWEKKKVVPFLKSDVGLAPPADGVQMMKDHPGLEDMLDRGLAKGVWGTKQRSQIQSANPEGIKKLVAQQFEFGKRTVAKGMIPILEPEVDITAKDKAAIEDLLLPELVAGLKTLGPDDKIIFKLTLPEKANLYKPLMSDPHVVRVVALSGGYDLAESNKRLAENNGMIASFSRTLREGLRVEQSDEEFTKMLGGTLDKVVKASST
jgi:fructose-bisphosphate aldolase class I